MNRGAQTKLGLTWTQNQSGSGMLKSVDPSSPVSSRSQLCQHQPRPHQISSQAEIPKTSARYENGPGFEWSTPNQRARLGSGKQGKLVVTQRNKSWGVTPLRNQVSDTRDLEPKHTERALPCLCVEDLLGIYQKVLPIWLYLWPLYRQGDSLLQTPRLIWGLHPPWVQDLEAWGSNQLGVIQRQQLLRRTLTDKGPQEDIFVQTQDPC